MSNQLLFEYWQIEWNGKYVCSFTSHILNDIFWYSRPVTNLRYLWWRTLRFWRLKPLYEPFLRSIDHILPPLALLVMKQTWSIDSLTLRRSAFSLLNIIQQCMIYSFSSRNRYSMHCVPMITIFILVLYWEFLVLIDWLAPTNGSAQFSEPLLRKTVANGSPRGRIGATSSKSSREILLASRLGWSGRWSGSPFPLGVREYYSSAGLGFLGCPIIHGWSKVDIVAESYSRITVQHERPVLVHIYFQMCSVIRNCRCMWHMWEIDRVTFGRSFKRTKNLTMNTNINGLRN